MARTFCIGQSTLMRIRVKRVTIGNFFISIALCNKVVELHHPRGLCVHYSSSGVPLWVGLRCKASPNSRSPLSHSLSSLAILLAMFLNAMLVPDILLNLTPLKLSLGNLQTCKTTTHMNRLENGTSRVIWFSSNTNKKTTFLTFTGQK